MCVSLFKVPRVTAVIPEYHKYQVGEKKAAFAHYSDVYISFIFKTLHVSAVNSSQPSSGVCIAEDLSTQS
jgi:hypothetical protein